MFISLSRILTELSIKQTSLILNLKKNSILMLKLNYKINFMLNNFGLKLYNNSFFFRNNILRHSLLLSKVNNAIKKYNTNFF